MVKMCYAVACVEDFVKSSHHCSTQYNLIKPGAQPARAWFLRIASVHECLYACVLACVCVCVSAPEAINN